MSLPLEQRGPIAWMARNPVVANLLMLTILIGGFVTAFRVKQEVFPEFDLDRVEITVPYPGASPEEIEKGILRAVEEEVNGLDGVKEVTSIANEGLGTVDVELQVGADDSKLLTDIKNAVDRITSFPEEAERPVVSLTTRRRQVISIVIYGDHAEAALRDLGEQMRDELLQDPRITLCELSGVRRPEIAVAVPQATLRAYGLTLDEIARQVRASAIELPGGGVKTPAGEVLFRTAERRDLGREFEDVPIIATRDGTELRLADIATITDGFEDTDEAAYFNGRPALMVDVYRVGDQTPIEVAKIVKEYVSDLRERLPPGIGLALWQDWSEIYRDRMRLLLRNAAIGLLLVLIVLALFLDLRLAFWVTMGIPVSFLGALLLQPVMDVSINMVSLFAFIMALGIVVDDAIIIGENIYEMRLHEKSFVQAAISGTRHVAAPVVFAVLTTIAAFMPLFFVSGTSGKFFRAIPAVIVTVFSFSLIESIFILPAHLGHQRRRAAGASGTGRAPRGLGRAVIWIVHHLYTPLVRAALRRRYLTVAVGLAVLAVTVGYVKGGHIKFTFMPRVESDLFFANAVLPYGAPVEATRAVARRLEADLRKVINQNGGDKIVRGIFTRIGGLSLGRGGHWSRGAQLGASHLAGVQVLLVPSPERDVTAGQLVAQWRDRTGDVPGLESLSFKYSTGPSGGAAVNIQLSHPDPEILEQAARDLAERLRSFQGVRDVDDDVAPGKPQLDFKVRPEAQSLGIRSVDIARQVRNAFYGAEALRQQRGRDEVKVMVRLPKSERISQYDVEELVIRTPSGNEIPLLEATEPVRGRAYTVIKRAGGRRVLNVTAEVVPGEGDSRKIVNELEVEALPALMAQYAGLRYSIEGEQKELKESLGSLRNGFIIALLFIFLLLAIPLKSYVQPLIVMTAIPFGVVGAVIGHVIMGYNLSLISMMGIVALSGVVVNDSLVLIHATNERRRQGAAALEAAVSAGVRRFRPIVLTSITTFFGLAPMIFETSIQARMLIPMAVALGFGILFSTLITLLLVPALYLIVNDLKRLYGASAAEARQE